MAWHDSPDSEERMAGCRKAAAEADRAAIPALARLLADPDRGVQDSAFEALRALGGAETAEAVLPNLASADERLRNLSREVLMPLGGVFPQVFLPYLRHDDVDVRIFVVEMLSAWKDPAVVPELSALVEGAHPNLRNQVAIALGDLALPEGVPVLAGLAADEDEWVRFSAVEALGKIPGEASLEALGSLARAFDPLLGPAALDALFASAQPSVIGIVLEVCPRIALDPACASRTVTGLLDLLEAYPKTEVTPEQVGSAHPVLAGVLEKGGLWDRLRAAKLVSLLGDREAVPILTRLAQEAEGPPQVAAIESLGRLKVPEAEPVLRALLKHKDSEVVERAREALNLMKKV